MSERTAMIQQLNVGLGERSYPIYIGHGIDLRQTLCPAIRGHQVLIVTNDCVAPLYLKQFETALNDAGHHVAHHVLPDGEKYKTLEQWSSILDTLLAAGFNRDCTIVALGGGVVGDMAGYAAASFQRGVDFVQVPTTLLAQVDSSVGGKTGINHPLGKNMIGAFKQPVAVVADMALLSTLPDRELAAGLAEVIKYALIGDQAFLRWLEDNMPKLVARDADALADAVYRSCTHKARVVAADEFENGDRALLNLGHTFGHAIEADQGYGSWLHGEAVAVGMLMAVDLSARQGWLKWGDVERIRRLLRQAGLPVHAPELPRERFKKLMSLDKKVLKGQLRLVLLTELGRGIVTSDYDTQALDDTLDAFQAA